MLQSLPLSLLDNKPVNLEQLNELIDDDINIKHYYKKIGIQAGSYSQALLCFKLYIGEPL